jgi:uncharacterized protein (TIGR02118 family)
MWRPRDGVPADDALAYWREEHAHLVARLPGVKAYVQQECVAGPDGARPPFVGVGELAFDTVEEARRALETPGWNAVLQDAATFMDLASVSAVWVEEHTRL